MCSGAIPIARFINVPAPRVKLSALAFASLALTGCATATMSHDRAQIDAMVFRPTSPAISTAARLDPRSLQRPSVELVNSRAP